MLFLLVFHSLAAQNQWSEPIVVSGGVTPDFDIDKTTGTLHIVTMLNGVKYTRIDSMGNILIPQEMITGGAEYDNRGRYSFGATIAVDQDGHPHVCYRNFDTYDYASSHYVHRRQGNWSGHRALSGIVERGFPIRMTIDGQNRVHIARIHALSNVDGRCTYHRIINGGLDRTEGWDIEFRPDTRVEIDAIGDNTVHLVMGTPKYPQGPVFYYRSYDAGSTIDVIGDIHSPECTYRNGNPDVFTDDAGNVHILYGASIDQSVDNYPSIRYVQYNGNTQTRHMIVTEKEWLETYPGPGVGLASIASSSDGNVIMIAYATKDIGDLYVIISRDRGATWSPPELIAQNVDSRPDGRGKHVIRAYRNNFYILYAETSNPDETDPMGYDCQIKLRYVRNVSTEMYVGVSGAVSYYANQLPIPDVRINWKEEANAIDTTDSQGFFSFNQFPYDSTVTLKPNKSRCIDPSISPILSYDAALVARTTVGLMDPFSSEQRTAADVDADGEITLYDAVQIARYVVGFEMPDEIPVGGWKFSPDSLLFNPIINNMTDQTFTGIMVGDVHGGWNISNQQEKAFINHHTLSIFPFSGTDDTIALPVGINGRGIFSLDMNCLYNPDLIELIEVEIVDRVNSFHLQYQEEKKGTVPLGIFGIRPLPNGIPLFELKFKQRHIGKNPSIQLDNVYLNAIRHKDIYISVNQENLISNITDSIRMNNFPNPFNEETAIRYNVPRKSWVQLTVINILGQKVITLLDKVQSPGNYQIHWDGRDKSGLLVPSGVYLSLLQIDDKITTGRMEKLR